MHAAHGGCTLSDRQRRNRVIVSGCSSFKPSVIQDWSCVGQQHWCFDIAALTSTAISISQSSPSLKRLHAWDVSNLNVVPGPGFVCWQITLSQAQVHHLHGMVDGKNQGRMKRCSLAVISIWCWNYLLVAFKYVFKSLLCAKKDHICFQGICITVG